MPKFPCKSCLIKPICTTSCDDMEKYKLFFDTMTRTKTIIICICILSLLNIILSMILIANFGESVFRYYLIPQAIICLGSFLYSLLSDDTGLFVHDIVTNIYMILFLVFVTSYSFISLWICFIAFTNFIQRGFVRIKKIDKEYNPDFMDFLTLKE